AAVIGPGARGAHVGALPVPTGPVDALVEAAVGVGPARLAGRMAEGRLRADHSVADAAAAWLARGTRVSGRHASSADHAAVWKEIRASVTPSMIRTDRAVAVTAADGDHDAQREEKEECLRLGHRETPKVTFPDHRGDGPCCRRSGGAQILHAVDGWRQVVA